MVKVFTMNHEQRTDNRFSGAVVQLGERPDSNREGHQFDFMGCEGKILQKFFLYILQSEKNKKYYIGITKDIETRLNQHNRGVGESTRSNRPWSLVYTEEYNTWSQAARREKQIKNQKSRTYIENLISSDR
jgi:putative endonuclease